MIAEKVGGKDILELLNKCSVDTDIEDQKVKSSIFFSLAKLSMETETLPLIRDHQMETVSRKNGLNVFVGDNATTKNIRSVKANAVDVFSNVMENPGHLHASGYVFECFASSHGPGGFFHIMEHVLNKY